MESHKIEELQNDRHIFSHDSVATICLPVEPVWDPLFWGERTLQKKARTPFKTRGPIWVPGGCISLLSVIPLFKTIAGLPGGSNEIRIFLSPVPFRMTWTDFSALRCGLCLNAANQHSLKRQNALTFLRFQMEMNANMFKYVQIYSPL